MSWDCELVNEKGETLKLEKKHNLKGGTYAVGGTDDCWLNVTYNYGRYIRECPDFPDGLDSLQDKVAVDTVQMFDNAIEFLNKKYKKNGRWIVRDREMVYFKNPQTGDLASYFDMRPENLGRWKECKRVEQVSEGQNSNYWLSTAGNVIKALKNLRYLADKKPYGMWHIC